MYKSFPLNLVAFSIAASLSLPAFSSVVRDDIDYQYFRDFAENKGKFVVGASNIPIHNKNGEFIGTVMPDLPMPDLSSVVRDGFAAAISPQYISSVKHNGGYRSVQFGGPTDHTQKNLSHPDAHYYDYIVVDRNDYQGEDPHINSDYHLPRLHKLITEIEPSVMTSAGRGSWTYLDKNRFPSFARVGAGTQGTRNTDNVTTQIADPYRYLLGGTPLNITRDDLDGWADASGDVFANYYSPLSNYAAPGDSGSPLWVFDKQENRWVYYAALRGGQRGIHGSLNSYIVTRKDWNNQTIQEDVAGTITNNSLTPLIWRTQDNTNSTISNGQDINLVVTLNNPDLVNQSKRPADIAKNNGKTVYFNGQDGVLRLMQNLNQGAGALYFDSNFTVEGENANTEWIGAGVSIAENKQVVWKLKNPANDRLSKIGKGTLLINGQGDNAGDISIGDGTVIFDQRNGKAFNKVGLVSGRPTLILNSSSQVDPNNLYFGFRGGRLDLNGNSLTFPRIQNVDEGARIVNNNATKTASITLTSAGNTGFNGYLGETDTSKHNGRLDVNYRPSDDNSLWLLSGGTALNGSLNVESGQLMLSGRPTPHAYDHLNKKEVIIEDDWINRNFNATNINVTNNASLWVGRNVSQVNSNFTANQNAKLNLGFLQNQTPECIRSDYTGIVQCDTKTLSEQAVNSSPISAINGNVQLNGNSQLNLSRAVLTGVVNGYTTSQIALHKDSQWTLTNDSTVGNLTLNEGSKVKLNHQKSVENDDYRTLTINGNLSGNGYFHFLTNISKQLGDKVIVNGIASGSHKLFVENSGSEPKKALTLLEANNAQQDPTKLNISLANPNSYVDLGAFRYHLENRNNHYVLALEYQTEKGNGVTTPELPEVSFKNGAGVTTPELPEVSFKNGAGVMTPELPEVSFKNGAGVTTPELPEVSFKNGAGVTIPELPEVSFKNGAGVTTPELPEVSFKNGAGVMPPELPEVNFKNGAGVTMPELPEVNFKNGAGVTTRELPEVSFKNGAGVTTPELPAVNSKDISVALPEIHFKNGSGVTSPELPIADLDSLLAKDKSETVEQPNTIKQNRIISRYSNGGLSEISAQVNGLLQINDNLHQAITDNSQDELKVWTKAEQQKTIHSSDNYRAYRQQLNLTQLGVEKDLDNQFRLGFVLSNSHTSGDFDDQISQKGRFTQVAIYGKKTWQNGTFVSLDGSYGKARNRLTHQGKTKFSRHILGTGVTLGQHWDLSGWEVTPAVAVRYARLSEVNYNFDGANIQVKPLNLLTYQAGVKVGRSFQLGTFQLHPELSSQFIDASHNKTKVNVNGHQLRQEFGRYARHQLGLTLKKANWEFTLSGGLQHGNEVKKQRIASLKFGYNW